MSDTIRKRILTGDRPTGKLHLGHFVGSHRHRLALQEQYECFFLVADLHMLTTKPDKETFSPSRTMRAPSSWIILPSASTRTR